MPATFIHERMVEFADTDAAGLMHFSNFFRFMESAEHAFLRSLGHTVHTETGDGLRGFVRVHAECDYRKPLRFEETVAIELRVREVNAKSVIYDFAFRRNDGSEAASGSMTVVCVRKNPQTQQVSAIDLPADLSQALRRTGI